MAVGIHYEIIENDKYVWVGEKNELAGETPSKEDIILYVDEVLVLEKPIQSAYSFKSNGFLYDWSDAGVQFTVNVIGFNSDEGRKVIESMIKP